MIRGGWDAVSRDDERMIEYVRDHPEIRDVIVSGGDPLTLPLDKLKFFLDSLAAITHVDVIRIGTRVPVTLPQRLYDQDLIDLLASAEKVWIQTHFNHPREITPEAARVCKALLRAGMPVNNHTVLLKGVNDDLETMRELMRGLLRIKVRPYYLFHCDPVIGAGHFRTSRLEGDGDHGGAARPHVRPGHPDLRRGQPARRRQDPAHAELPGVARPTTRSSCATTRACSSATRPRTSRTRPSRPPPAASARCCRATGRSSIPEGNERMARRQARGRAGGCGGGSHPEVTDEAAAELLTGPNGHAGSADLDDWPRRAGRVFEPPYATRLGCEPCGRRPARGPWSFRNAHRDRVRPEAQGPAPAGGRRTTCTRSSTARPPSGPSPT